MRRAARPASLAALGRLVLDPGGSGAYLIGPFVPSAYPFQHSAKTKHKDTDGFRSARQNRRLFRLVQNHHRFASACICHAGNANYMSSWGKRARAVNFTGGAHAWHNELSCAAGIVADRVLCYAVNGNKNV